MFSVELVVIGRSTSSTSRTRGLWRMPDQVFRGACTESPPRAGGRGFIEHNWDWGDIQLGGAVPMERDWLVLGE